MPSRDRRKRKKEADLQKSASKSMKLAEFWGQAKPKDTPAATTSTVTVSSGEDEPHQVVEPMVAEVGPSRPLKKATSKRTTLTATVKSWGLDWLGFEEGVEGGRPIATRIWCNLCREYKGLPVVNDGQRQLTDVDAFVTGTFNVKKDTAVVHGKRSKTHLQAMAAKDDKDKKKTVAHMLTKMSPEIKARMNKLFDWAYLVAKLEQPFTDYKHLVEMENKHTNDLGQAYRNDKACKEFTMIIGDGMEDEMLNAINTKPSYFSILFDGSTDGANTEKEVISIKYMDPKTAKPTMKPLGICHPDHVDAEGLFDSITAKLEEKDLNIQESLVAICADGASVNFGKQTGVLVRIEEAGVPWLLKIHCLAHRLELSLKDAFKDSFFVKTSDDLLMNLYYFFKRSSKRWRQMKALEKVLGKSIVKPVRAHGTRWIDHRRRAVEALDCNYETMVTLFEDFASDERTKKNPAPRKEKRQKKGKAQKDISPADKAKIRGYLRILKGHKFVICLSLYSDILSDLSKLSLTLQSDETPLSSIRATTESTIALLNQKKDRAGYNLRKVQKQVSEDLVFRGHKLSGEFSAASLKKLQVDTITRIMEHIEIRFIEFTENPVLLAADLIDIQNIPNFPAGQVQDQRVQAELRKYGVDHCETLIKHFHDLLVKQGCEVDKIEQEWMEFKLHVARNPTLRSMHYLDFWASMILQEKQVRFPNLLHLVRILLVCPVASAFVERQFSIIKRIMGDWRLSMGLRTCENLLRICCTGPKPSKFDPQPHVARWWTNKGQGGRSRRPNSKPYGAKRKQQQNPLMLSDTSSHSSDEESPSGSDLSSDVESIHVSVSDGSESDNDNPSSDVESDDSDDMTMRLLFQSDSESEFEGFDDQ